MRTRKLGRTDLELPVVTFGAWAIGGWHWGGTDDELAVRALREGLERGMTAIDTAPIYGFGHSERIVGRALAGRRDEALVLTKVGLRWDDERGEPAFRTEGPDGRVVVRRNARPDSIRTEVERSLERLAVDTLDLVQVHWPDPTTPIADTMGALLELRREGKLRAIGVSNFSVAELEAAARALGDVPLASDQPQYSLVARRAEEDILPWAAEHAVGTLVYSPLEQGLLTGAVDAARTFAAGDGRAQRATFAPRNRALVNAALDETVRPIAERHGATLAQVVIAWTVEQLGVTSAIVGARRPEQARENAAAGDLVLAPPELARMRAAFEALALHVPRKDATLARLGRFVARFLGRG